MKGGESAEYFNSGWDGDDYCCRCKVCSCIYVYSDGKHVVGSYDKAQEADGYYCSDHAYISKGFFFACVIGNNV